MALAILMKSPVFVERRIRRNGAHAGSEHHSGLWVPTAPKMTALAAPKR
jgi:hypothetical protein